MHWFAGVSYLTAAVVSQLSVGSPMLAFISVILAVWLGISVVLENYSANPSMAPAEPNGWSGSTSVRNLESLKERAQLAFWASLMRLSLILFGFLLMTWALLL